MLGEWTHDLDATGPGQRCRPLGLIASPARDEVAGQRPAMARRVGKTRECQQLRSRDRQREAETAALIEVLLHQVLHRHGHAALPGQGSATAVRRAVSILV